MGDKNIINLNDVHPDFNVYRFEKFKLDIEDRRINKICMTEIINADMMIATVGLGAYSLGCKEVLTQGRNDVKAMGLENCLIHYVYNYKNFIVAGTEDISDEDFKKIMQLTYEQYVHSNSKSADLSALSRFVLVFGDDLIDKARSAFYFHRKTQNNYIIASNERELLNTENKADIETFSLINYAINENKVIPYYQGIYNNAANRIDKYEALMRISDANGKIYAPGMFLDTSKKYKLYSTLSKMLINTALNDFESKQSELCINVSLFDVENDDFVTWFIDRVRNFPQPQNLTIEFVETENYNSGQKLYSFLNTVREFGCKIAVDDFGVGFATYTSIMSLKPDIIKIDGQIIKDLVTNQDNRNILYSINYMSNLIHSKTVAEFVENPDIQEILLAEKIDYSQGYHFSRPLPIEQLDII